MSLATWFATQGLGDVGKAHEKHGYTRMEDVKELGRDDLVNTLDFDEADADKRSSVLHSSLQVGRKLDVVCTMSEMASSEQGGSAERGGAVVA